MAVLNGGESYPFYTPGSSGPDYQDFYVSGNFGAGGSGPSTTGSATTATQVTPMVYVYWVLGLIVFFILLKYASEHEKAQMELGDIRIGVWNIVAITMSAGLGIFVAKMGVNKFPQTPTALKNIVNTI